MILTTRKSKEVLSHQPCPCGLSSDGYTIYDDGHGYCYGQCGGKLFQEKQEVAMPPKPTQAAAKPDEPHSLQYYPMRGLTVDTMRFLDIKTKVSDATGEPFARIVTFPNGTEQHKYFVDKSFRTYGDHASEPTLMFMDKFPSGSARSVTITEGAEDAASFYQVLGPNHAVVSVRSSSSARKDCASAHKYLDSFDRIYLALDDDEPGQKAAQQIVEMFDFNKVFHVNLGKYKDANGYLQAGLDRELRAVWNNSKKYLPDGIVSSFEDFEQIIKEDSKRPSIPYPTEGLQNVIKGIRDGEVILITAQEGVGKTEFCRLLEHHILTTTDAAIGCIHLEETKADQLKRMAGYHLKVPAHFEGAASDTEIVNALKAIVRDNPNRYHLYGHFDTDDLDVLLNRIRFLVTACGCKYVFLDHITMLVTGRDDKDERILLDYLSTRLGRMVADLGFTLFLVSHVNDDGKTRGSRNIGKIAHTRIDLSRNTLAENEEEKNKMYVSVPKNRWGASTGLGGILWFDTESFTLGEYKAPVVPVPVE